jgi:hypothetical protein
MVENARKKKRVRALMAELGVSYTRALHIYEQRQAERREAKPEPEQAVADQAPDPG